MKRLLIILVSATMFFSCDKQEKQTPSDEPQMAAGRKKNPRSALRVGGDLFNTQGLQISGSFHVGRGPTEDTLIGVVTNWNGLWHDYHFNWCPPIYSTLPGGEGATNYGQWQPQIPVPFTYTTIIPHGGVTQCYFFGVSSEYGANVAGKSVTVN